MPVLYRYLSTDSGNCRVYYRGPNGGLYCIQDEGRRAVPRVGLYVCSKDGEPSHHAKMPPREAFDRYEESLL